MSKFTPGPWKFDWEDDNRTWAIVKSPTGKIIANVNTESGPDIAPLVSEKMPAQSNAQLIAAAPDIYEALKIILEYPYGDASPLDDPLVMKQARAAIAKAEGRE